MAYVLRSRHYCHRHRCVFRPTNGISLFLLYSACPAHSVDRILLYRRNSHRLGNISRTANSWAIRQIVGLATASILTHSKIMPISVPIRTDRLAKIVRHRYPFASPVNVWWHLCNAVDHHCCHDCLAISSNHHLRSDQLKFILFWINSIYMASSNSPLSFSIFRRMFCRKSCTLHESYNFNNELAINSR